MSEARKELMHVSWLGDQFLVHDVPDAIRGKGLIHHAAGGWCVSSAYFPSIDLRTCTLYTPGRDRHRDAEWVTVPSSMRATVVIALQEACDKVNSLFVGPVDRAATPFGIFGVETRYVDQCNVDFRFINMPAACRNSGHIVNAGGYTVCSLCKPELRLATHELFLPGCEIAYDNTWLRVPTATWMCTLGAVINDVVKAVNAKYNSTVVPTLLTRPEYPDALGIPAHLMPPCESIKLEYEVYKSTENKTKETSMKVTVKAVKEQLEAARNDVEKQLNAAVANGSVNLKRHVDEKFATGKPTEPQVLIPTPAGIAATLKRYDDLILRCTLCADEAVELTDLIAGLDLAQMLNVTQQVSATGKANYMLAINGY